MVDEAETATPRGAGSQMQSLSLERDSARGKSKGKGAIAAGKEEAVPSASSGASGGSKGVLRRPDVYVRIRPLATDGSNHSEDGTVLVKHLESWDEGSVTIETQYLFSKEGNRYTFPKHVFGTEASQEEVCGGMVPDLVDSFTADNTSVLFFAYGQTGTGKTRTMLGTEPSLASAAPHDDWGVFPRVCAATFERLESLRQTGRVCVLTASAIEFYLGECFDLLKSSRSGNAPVQIDFETHAPSGESCIVLEQQSDLMDFLAKVIANRTSRSTNFNKVSAEHSGSSRSHAALILTLMQLDKATRLYSKTTFTLVDLAGAERADKVREEVKGGSSPGGMASPEFMPNLIEARDSGSITQKQIDAMLPLNFQTRMINFELFQLGHQVVNATEAHRKRKPYAPPKAMVTPTIKFLSAILTGKARLAMMVTLSPAGRNAWETWFSLQYGSDLSKLHAPKLKDKPKDVDKLYKVLSKTATELKQAVDSMGKGHRYYAQKKHKAEVAAEQLRRIDLLLAAASGASSC